MHIHSHNTHTLQAHRLFGALRENQIQVVMISQAGSEHSICLVVQSIEVDRAVKVIEKEFRY